jgi:DNA-binding MarR family transcriptional regulator
MEKLSESFTPLYGYQDIGFISALILGWLITQKSLEKPISASYLAERFKVNKWSIYNNINRLQEKGYITYNSICNVGITVTLTDKAKELKAYFNRDSTQKPNYITTEGFVRVFAYFDNPYKNAVMSYLYDFQQISGIDSFDISIRELSRKINVNKRTIHKVLESLEKERILGFFPNENKKHGFKVRLSNEK